MSEQERRRISEYIERQFGIKMPANKKSLLEGRLAKRLHACGLDNYGSYFDFVILDPAGQDEYLRFADLVSTHETSFFREARHFQYLEQTVLPQICSRTTRRQISGLCAACSTGEEAYTLAMTIDASIRKLGARNLAFTIEGVDLSDHAVAVAQRGVYLLDRIHDIPEKWRHQYLMVSKDRKRNLCRFAPELRQHLVFHTGNLLGSLNQAQASYDLVFCRNVLIYFDRDNQRRVVGKLLDLLEPDGLLFLGHSESLVSLDLPLRSVANAVYRKN